MAGSSEIRAGGAYVEISARDTALKGGLARAKTSVAAFARGAGAMFLTAAKAATALGVAAAGISAIAVRSYARYGDSVAKMARRTGLSAQAVSGLAHAAELSGTSISGLENGLRRMQRAIGEASWSKTAALPIKELGLEVKSLSRMRPEKQLEAIADRLRTIKDPGKQATIAMQLFGRAGTELLPLLQQGSEGMRAMKAEASWLGLTLSDEAAAGAEKFTDAMTRLKGAFKGLRNAYGEWLVPILEPLVVRLTEITVGFGKAMRMTDVWADSFKNLKSAIDDVNAGLWAMGNATAELITGKAYGQRGAIDSWLKWRINQAQTRLGVISPEEGKRREAEIFSDYRRMRGVGKDIEEDAVKFMGEGMGRIDIAKSEWGETKSAWGKIWGTLLGQKAPRSIEPMPRMADEGETAAPKKEPKKWQLPEKPGVFGFFAGLVSAQSQFGLGATDIPRRQLNVLQEIARNTRNDKGATFA